MSSLNGNKAEVQAKYLTVLADDVNPGQNITPIYDEPMNYETNDNSENMDDTRMNIGTATEYVKPNPKSTHASEAQVAYKKRKTGIEDSAFVGSDEDRRENTGNGSKTKKKKRLMLIAFVVVFVLLAVIVTALITYFAVKSSSIEIVKEKNDSSRVMGGNDNSSRVKGENGTFRQEYDRMFTKFESIIKSVYGDGQSNRTSTNGM